MKTKKREKTKCAVERGGKGGENAIRARSKEVVDDSNLSCFRPAEEARPSAPIDPEEDGRAERRERRKEAKGKKRGSDDSKYSVAGKRKRDRRERERERKREKM